MLSVYPGATTELGDMAAETTAQDRIPRDDDSTSTDSISERLLD
jgi:hypothetical protein